MRWPKREIWKAGIALAGMLLLLILMVWVPMSAVGADEGASGPATPTTGTMQATPTVDATMTALNKQKLERDNDRSFQAWFWSSGATLLSTLALVIGGFIGFLRWRVDRREAQDKDRVARQDAQGKELADRLAEREKRDEERFQSVVEGLGSEREEAKVGAAILLRTFLRPGYEQFYTQTFDLAVAHLRLPRTPNPPEDLDNSLPLTTLSQALIVVFKEAFPLARDRLKEQDPKSEFHPPSLDATSVNLDCAFLGGNWVDLKHAWMPEVSMRKADLRGTNLSKALLSKAKLSRADLSGADLTGAELTGADLAGARLSDTNLTGASLRWVNLSGAILNGADLSGANLTGANLVRANLTGANLTGANLGIFGPNAASFFGEFDIIKLSHTEYGRIALRRFDRTGVKPSGVKIETDLTGADLSGADLSGADLSGVRLEDALSLENTNLCGVTGLSYKMLEALKNEKGAIIDEDSTTSSSQAPVSPPAPSQSNDVQVPSAQPAQGGNPTPVTDGSSAASSQESNDTQAPSAQVSTPTPDIGGSSATSSKLGPES